MGYYFRHFAKANPYHDEIGRFTDAENAVLFVRPISGYHDTLETPDSNWRGAYKDGKRYDVRREKNPLVKPFAEHPKQHELNLVKPPAPHSGVASSPAFTSVNSALREALKNSPSLDEANNHLNRMGMRSMFNAAPGINAGNLVITIPVEGQEYKFMMKRIDDHEGVGALGELLGTQLMRELGVNVPTREMSMFTENGKEYVLSSWTEGQPTRKMNDESITAAVKATGASEIAKSHIVEFLAGDADRHTSNYVVTPSDKVVGIDYGRMGMYEGRGNSFQSVVLNAVAATRTTFDATNFNAFIDRAKATIQTRMIDGSKGKDVSWKRWATGHLEHRTDVLKELFKVESQKFDFLEMRNALSANEIGRKNWANQRANFPFIPGRGW